MSGEGLFNIASMSTIHRHTGGYYWRCVVELKELIKAVEGLGFAVLSVDNNPYPFDEEDSDITDMERAKGQSVRLTMVRMYQKTTEK